jgi:uncharacterized protein (TIGR04255 family)
MKMIPAEARQQFAPEELAEQFPNAPLQEVSSEARFVPKLRIPSEIWKLQENLASAYPSFGQENTVTPTGLALTHYFSTSDGQNKILASQSNFALIARQYPGFSAFLDEVVQRTQSFCSIYEISSFIRLGLRYTNQFLLPGSDRTHLQDFVNPFVNFNRIDLASTTQFVVDIRSSVADHKITTRTALLDDPAPAYVLDIDCYADSPSRVSDVRTMLSKFHESAKTVFLEHITPTLKKEFRRKVK